MNKKPKEKKLKLSKDGEIFTAEKLMKKRKKGNQVQYLVKWKDWAYKDATWEPERNILDNSK